MIEPLTIEDVRHRATVTVPEAAQICEVSSNAAYRAVAAGELPSLRLGRRIVIPVPALLRLLGAYTDPLGGDAA